MEEFILSICIFIIIFIAVYMIIRENKYLIECIRYRWLFIRYILKVIKSHFLG